MYVNRNRRRSYIRGDKRPNYVRSAFLLVLLVGLIGMGVFAATRPAQVRSLAAAYLGPEQTPTPLPSDYARRGIEAYNAGELQMAADFFEQAVAGRPDSVDYLYEYGQVLIDLGNPDPAEDIARQIIDLAPSDPRGYALRALAMVWQGNSSGALPVALAGLDIDPEFGPLHTALSRAYAGQARWRESQEAGLQAIEFAPGDVHSYWAYASSLAAVGARDAAEREYQQAINVNPAFTPPYFELAYIYLATGRDEEAIALYDRVLGMQPRNARALLRKCEAFRKVGEFQQALGLCEDAVTSDPEYAPARYRLGVILYDDQQDFAAAQREFEMCLQYDSDNVYCKARLGLSQYYRARETFTQTCGGRQSADCDATSLCAASYEILQESLVMAQSQTNTDDVEEGIRLGLRAINEDVACAGVTGRRFPTPIPTLTPEAEATEATAGTTGTAEPMDDPMNGES